MLFVEVVAPTKCDEIKKHCIYACYVSVIAELIDYTNLV
jgi:hypothetical protein